MGEPYRLKFTERQCMMSPDTVTIKIPDTAPAATPSNGIVTSEFLATVASVIAFGIGLVPDQYAPLVAGLVGVYVACRTLLKAVHVLGYAKKIPDLPALPDGVVRQTTTTTELKQ